jgi:thiamine-phosphate pyrophosphorylase
VTRIPSPLLVVTDRHQVHRPLEQVVAEAVSAGARWVWLRDRDLDPAERRRLALGLADIVQSAGGLLSIGGDIGLAAEIRAGAVHLPDVAGIAQARQALGASVLVGLSAHSMVDVTSAQAAGADYVTLSPIYETTSKPGYGPALGIEAVRLAAKASIAIVGLGGISAENAAAVRGAGAAGVAIMGSVMRATNPAQVVRDMLSRLEPSSA